MAGLGPLHLISGSDTLQRVAKDPRDSQTDLHPGYSRGPSTQWGQMLKWPSVKSITQYKAEVIEGTLRGTRSSLEIFKTLLLQFYFSKI